jgi:hypothetical protein
MTANLNVYFSQYAENALLILRDCMLAKNYYEGIAKRLRRGEDFSEELPDIAKVSPKDAKVIVQKALKEFDEKRKNAWVLPKGLSDHCTSKVTEIQEYGEILPRFTVAHQFETDAGQVRVFITTKGNNYQIDIKAGRNKMAAEAAMNELDKLITFTLMLN